MEKQDTFRIVTYRLKINNMKYKVDINLKPRPVLQELIQDLEGKLNATKISLAGCGAYANYHFKEGLKNDIKLLEAVLGRVIAQQELIDARAEQIIGLN